MNSSFRNLQICLYPAHTNAIGCGKVALCTDFMRFPLRYPLRNGQKIGCSASKRPKTADLRGKSACGRVSPRSSDEIYPRSAGFQRRAFVTLKTIFQSFSQETLSWQTP